MTGYNLRFHLRFMVGGVASLMGMAICMHYGLVIAGGDGRVIVSSILPLFTTLVFFGDVRLLPFREYREGLRTVLPGWDWAGDIAAAVTAAGIATALWLGTLASLLALGLYHIPAVRILSGGLMVGGGYWLSWVVCTALGLVPAPLKPGWGE